MMWSIAQGFVIGLAVCSIVGVESLNIKDPLVAIEDPKLFAKELAKVLDTEKNLPTTLVKAAQNFIGFLAINDKLQSTCNSYSIRWVKAALLSSRLALELSDKMDEQGQQRCQKIAKMTEKVLFKHSELCQPIYEQKYESFEEELKKQAVSFGEDFMYHLMSIPELSAYCAAKTDTMAAFNRDNSQHLDGCVLRSSSALLTMTEQMDNLVGPTVIFRMLLDYARNEPNVADLMTAHEPQSHGLFRSYMMDACKRVSALGAHLFRPIEFDRQSYKPAGGKHEMKSRSKEFIYAWMAHSVCENYVLNPNTMKMLSHIAAMEKDMRKDRS